MFGRSDRSHGGGRFQFVATCSPAPSSIRLTDKDTPKGVNRHGGRNRHHLTSSVDSLTDTLGGTAPAGHRSGSFCHSSPLADSAARPALARDPKTPQRFDIDGPQRRPLLGDLFGPRVSGSLPAGIVRICHRLGSWFISEVAASADALTACQAARRPLTRLLWRTCSPLVGGGCGSTAGGGVALSLASGSDALPGPTSLSSAQPSTWEHR